MVILGVLVFLAGLTLLYTAITDNSIGELAKGFVGG